MSNDILRQTPDVNTYACPNLSWYMLVKDGRGVCTYFRLRSQGSNCRTLIPLLNTSVHYIKQCVYLSTMSYCNLRDMNAPRPPLSGLSITHVATPCSAVNWFLLCYNCCNPCLYHGINWSRTETAVFIAISLRYCPYGHKGRLHVNRTDKNSSWYREYRKYDYYYWHFIIMK